MSLTLSFPLPMLYADHHVLEVRRLLLALPGVNTVYASSSFQIVEVNFEESELSKDEIQSTLAQAGYVDELPVVVESSRTTFAEGGKQFFRHTAVFPQTDRIISFGQDVPDVERPLWPCPGIKSNQ